MIKYRVYCSGASGGFRKFVYGNGVEDKLETMYAYDTACTSTLIND